MINKTNINISTQSKEIINSTVNYCTLNIKQHKLNYSLALHYDKLALIVVVISEAVEKVNVGGDVHHPSSGEDGVVAIGGRLTPRHLLLIVEYLVNLGILSRVLLKLLLPLARILLKLKE